MKRVKFLVSYSHETQGIEEVLVSTLIRNIKISKIRKFRKI